MTSPVPKDSEKVNAVHFPLLSVVNESTGLGEKLNGKEIPDDIHSEAVPSVKANGFEVTGTPAKKNKYNVDLLFTLEESPPWYQCILLGFQHYLTYLGSMLPKTYLILPLLCVGADSPARALIISTTGFVSGITTLFQTILGIRLPIIQGPGLMFIIPMVVHLNSKEWKCPDMTMVNKTGSELEEYEEFLWQARMREIQGAVIISAVFQMVFSLTGLISLAQRVITPLVILPVMTLSGLTLFEKATKLSSGNWGLSLGTIILVVVFSEILRNVNLPCCMFDRGKGCVVGRMPVFKLYSVLLSVGIIWVLSAILTVSGVFPEGSPARTDSHMKIIEDSPWFRFPYPGQWGMPTVSFAGVFGMIAAVLSSFVDSIGDYYACARLIGVPKPPKHAVNRGIFAEGVGCLASGIWGSGNSSASFTANLGIIGITKVASRRVVEAAALVMIFFGMMCKFGAIFVMIPEPIIGGVFFVLFSTMLTVGLTNLETVRIGASRNLIVVGFPLFFGFAFPKWLEDHPDAIQTGSPDFDSVLQVVLSTSVFVGGCLGLLLDNVVPGTPEERGLVAKHEEDEDYDAVDEEELRCYDLPFGMSLLRKWRFTQYIPISPTYDSGHYDCWGKCSKKSSKKS